MKAIFIGCAGEAIEVHPSRPQEEDESVPKSLTLFSGKEMVKGKSLSNFGLIPNFACLEPRIPSFDRQTKNARYYYRSRAREQMV